MITPRAWVILLALVGTRTAPAAQPAGSGHAVDNRRTFLSEHPETETLTGDWFGAGDDLRDASITTTLNLWMLWQASVTGGLETDSDFNGLYYWGTHFDLERMAGWNGASAFVRVDGGWNDGISASVGDLMDVNGLAVGDEPIGVTRLWFDQELLDRRLRFRVGKIDVTTENFDFHGQSVTFDAMPVANNFRAQFLDNGLVNNASVPFPKAGLAGLVLVEPADRWFITAGGFQSNTDEFGWRSSFEDWMVSVEGGVVASIGGLDGLYYAGWWYSTFPGAPDGQGVYVGVAQDLTRVDGADDQGLTAFFRYGFADRNASGVEHFLSVGGQYAGPFGGREDDVLAVGWAQAFTDDARFSAPYEGVLEAYYRARITPWFHVSPHVQYVVNPGSNDVPDAFTLGVRGQITF